MVKPLVLIMYFINTRTGALGGEWRKVDRMSVTDREASRKSFRDQSSSLNLARAIASQKVAETSDN